MSNQLDEALNNLDLHGVLMVQGLLVNRALQILHDQKEKEKTILTPSKKLIL